MKNSDLCVIIAMCMFFLGCENKQGTMTSSTKEGGTVTNANGIFQNSYDLTEFEYKGHTYISCQVRDGISLTHAGHCKCNKK